MIRHEERRRDEESRASLYSVDEQSRDRFGVPVFGTGAVAACVSFVVALADGEVAIVVDIFVVWFGEGDVGGGGAGGVVEVSADVVVGGGGKRKAGHVFVYFEE